MRGGGPRRRVRNLLPGALAKRGVSFGELARRARLSVPVVARLRATHSNPSLDVVERLAAALDRPVEALFRLQAVGRRRPWSGGSPRRGLGPLLAERGWSEEQLARAAGLDRAHLNRIKNGRARPTIGTALAIARALAVPVAIAFPASRARRVRPGRASRAQSQCDFRA